MSDQPRQPWDNALWRDLVRSQTPALVLFAQQWCRFPEDVVQEAFLKLFRQQPPPERPTAWLYTVVRREAMNASRSERRRRTREQQVAERRPDWFERSERDVLETDRLQESLGQLAEELREIVVARVWGNLTLQEVAMVTGASIATVHRRYQSALELLRESLDPDVSSVSESPSSSESSEHER